MIKTQYGNRQEQEFGLNVQIDYDQLSQNLMGSAQKHKRKFDLMRKTHTRLNNIKKAFGGMTGQQKWVDYRHEDSVMKNNLIKGE